MLAALRAGLADVFGSAALTGRTVMIVGLGAVGTHLARDLARAGARVAVSDVDDRKRSIAAKLQLDWVAPDKALAVPVDVLVPAAVGGVFSTSTIPRLAAPLIVGPANNQLTRDGVADELASAGIVWVPDFVASAGGIVYTLAREIDNIEHAAAMRRVRGIGETTGQLLAAARAEQSTPLAQAQLLAARRLTGR